MTIPTRALIASFLLLAAEAKCAPPSDDYCSCLEAASHDATGRRDGAWGVSVVIPVRARKKFIDGIDSHAVQWNDPASATIYSFDHGWHPVRFHSPTADECLLRVNQKRVLISESRFRGKIWVFANYEMGRADLSTFDMSVAAPSKKRACSAGGRMFWSAVFGAPSLSGITVVGIPANRKSFRYENAPGAEMVARVGDKIYNSYSVVKAISEKSVTIKTLDPDGLGGWTEVDRVFQLGGSSSGR